MRDRGLVSSTLVYIVFLPPVNKERMTPAWATVSLWRVLLCCALIGSFALISSPSTHAQSPAPHIVISEVQISGATAADEFVELYNPTGSPIVMSGWKLTRKNSAGTQENLVLSLNGTIPAYGFFLIGNGSGYDGSVLLDVIYSAPSNSLTNNYAVLLYSDDEITLIDKVGFGGADDFEGAATSSNPTTNGSIERKATAASTSASMDGNGGDISSGNGYDTGDNSNDFVLRATSDPQNSSSDPEQLPEMTLTASAVTVSQTEPVQFTIAIEQAADLADYSLTLSYDPLLFAFDVAQFHAALAPVASESVNASTPGQVTVTQQGEPLTGNGSLFTLHFLAQTTAGLGTFSLQSATFANNAASPINGVITPSAVQVAAADRATLQGHVTVQGRTNHSGVSVYLYPGVNNHHTTTDSSGFWQFETAWPTRHNYLLFRLDGYLDHLEAGVLAPEGGAKNIPTFVLKGGDANWDRVINVQDVAFIGNRFGLAPVTSADAQADLNGDGTINVLDLTMSASNYGVVIGAAASVLPEDVRLWLEAFYP